MIVAMGVLAALAGALPGEVPTRLVIEPGEVALHGRGDTAQVIVAGHFADGSVRDLTRAAAWASATPAVVAVEAGGRLKPIADGRGEVVARVGEVEARVPVVVADSAGAAPISFAHDLLPALSKAGCNMGACHGTPTGKGGFRLSLRGYDPKLDFQTLGRELGQRRSNPFEPERSLILQKGSGTVEHGGGRRFGPGDLAYRLVRDWIAEGSRPEPAGSPALVGIEVTPNHRVLDRPADAQQLVVRARFADGSARDVTRLARYSTSDEAVAGVEDSGLARKRRRGEATVLVAFESAIATSRLVFLDPVPGLVWSDPPENNFVDTHLFAKLKLLRLPPSELSDDRTFLRRVSLDVTGLPPTPEAIRAFVADDRPDKRARLIDQLLDSPEHVDYWAMKWADRLGCNQRFVGIKGAFSYHRWIRDQIAANVPFDRFVRAIVTARGPNYTTPPASFYRRLRDPMEAAESVSQLFLGVRVQCARCHNHVAERWTQDDYYGLAAFFGQVRFKNGPQTFALYNKEETVFLDPAGAVVQPRTGAVMTPRPLGGPALAIDPGADRREALADWLVAPGNPFFAKAAVNRLWFHLFGRGIVDPVDDLRDSNPPASAELLEALADDFATHGFDVRRTLRTILNSRAYQLASTPNAFNADDARYFSHALVRPLPAEALLDAASRATGVDEPLFQLPPGSRAAQVPDGELVHPFLKTFGQPARAVACECEREGDTTLEQALQIIGGRTIHAKIAAPSNRIGARIAEGASDAALAEDLFLATLGRPPIEAEGALAVARLSGASDRRRAAEDVLWSLLNHPEFLFQH